MNEEFKPCPFCGSDQLLVEVGEDGGSHVECLDCRGRTGGCVGWDGAVSAWNSRAEPPAAPVDARPNPGHYEGDGEVSCARALRSMTWLSTLPPMQLWWWGCAFKYLWRWPWKNGADDLRKAHDCIGRLLEEVSE
ncbi:Lar family restriction alleviation protein [Gordonibacter pamelaeae]|uniref:Lar family restriction alleviation protein n=1 Tax=Gordonibacter pamelaeae TaxID=471189 RepID=UPI003A8F3F69